MKFPTSDYDAQHVELKKGDVVFSLRVLDPSGANVPHSITGVVIEEENAHADGGGPIVQWENGGTCNVYPGDVVRRA